MNHTNSHLRLKQLGVDEWEVTNTKDGSTLVVTVDWSQVAGSANKRTMDRNVKDHVRAAAMATPSHCWG